MSEERVGISARVIADSTTGGSRLTTFEATFPRFILAEFNTHRVFSRNSASSRAIPVWKRLADLLEHPFVPIEFGKNKAGMQSTAFVGIDDADAAAKNWLVGRDVAVIQAFFLAGGAPQIMTDSKGNPRADELCKKVEDLSYHYLDVIMKLKPLSVGIHKQHANRVLEPYAWHTVIVTGTAWRNFYALRASVMAQPEIKALAVAMARAHFESCPVELGDWEWHLPFIRPEDREEIKDWESLARISSARCARVSYLTHDGRRDLDKDLSMAANLQGNGHMSPFEHPACPSDYTMGSYGGNFGEKWRQYRKLLDREWDFSRFISEASLLEGLGDPALVEFVRSLPE